MVLIRGLICHFVKPVALFSQKHFYMRKIKSIKTQRKLMLLNCGYYNIKGKFMIQ